MILLHKSEVIRYNDEFLRFLGIYGINSTPCMPRRARTKGKVERPFFYIKEHLLRGLRIEDISEFEGIIKDFTEIYNLREHSTLKKAPNDMFEEEKPYLISIPYVEPRIIFNMDLRKVTVLSTTLCKFDKTATMDAPSLLELKPTTTPFYMI